MLAAMLAASTTAALAQESGADTYKAKCAMCHGADGLAANAMGKMYKIPPFNSPDVVKMSDADLIAATKNGKGKMPAYAGKLTDPQIKDVVAYIRTLQK
jgi:mono/diheme cytochrome c family protein